MKGSPDEQAGPATPLRLGVLGTLVWDRIFHHDGGGVPVAEWGGISYAMEALSVVLPEGWVMKPLLKVGEDLGEEALEYVAAIPRVEMGPNIRVEPFQNYQVELRYQDETERLERLDGEVPPWNWDELEPLLSEVDALYLNFITGFELGIETARRLPERFPGPIYADLHSLFQGLSPAGQRFPQELPERGEWFRSFDAIQMNEGEFGLLGRPQGDPWGLAADTVGPDLKLISVTLGAEGAAYVSAGESLPRPMSWPGLRGSPHGEGTPKTGRVPLSENASSGDPTGCGDVWGATFFARILGGDPLEIAMREANRMAAKNVEYRGARGLRHHLRGESAP